MDASARLPQLESFFDQLSDGVLLFDRRAEVIFANAAVLRHATFIPDGGLSGSGLVDWLPLLGAPLASWVRSAIASADAAPDAAFQSPPKVPTLTAARTPGFAAARQGRALPSAAAAALAQAPTASNLPLRDPPPAVAARGAVADVAWQNLGPGLYALRLRWGDTATRSAANHQPSLAETRAPSMATNVAGPVIAELMHVLWESPFPALLQDTQSRIVDVNPAFLAFSGFTRQQLVGSDPIQLEPAEDRANSLLMRERWNDPAHRDREPALMNRRLLAADGRERWFRATRRRLTDERARVFTMSVLQDCTAEHVARERADRSAREIDDWFDLSPMGMVLFDEAGLLVRTNPAFDALVGSVPEVLSHATPELRALLGWLDDGPMPALQPNAQPLVLHGWLPSAQRTPHPGAAATDADAPVGLRRLRSIVRCYVSPSGQPRHMAIVEDRSMEEERDLAQMQIGTLMDTAGLGLATFQETAGWVPLRESASSKKGDANRSAARTHGTLPPLSAALQTISRDIVVAESMVEYDVLQMALRTAQRAEVRYAAST